jgi:hypothetical protein
MSKKDQDFKAPQSTDLTGQADESQATQATPANNVPAESTSSTDEASYEKNVEVVAINKMVNAKGDATTDIIVQRINTHMEFLSGRKRYKDKAEETQEQVTFIETIGNTLKLDFPQYALVTDALLNAMRENKDVFDHGLAFRFTKGLERTYPSQYIRTYQNYITFLTMVSKNWVSRYKLDKLIDPAYMVQDFDRKAKENVTQYFRLLTQA